MDQWFFCEVYDIWKGGGDIGFCVINFVMFDVEMVGYEFLEVVFVMFGVVEGDGEGVEVVWGYVGGECCDN